MSIMTVLSLGNYPVLQIRNLIAQHTHEMMWLLSLPPSPSLFLVTCKEVVHDVPFHVSQPGSSLSQSDEEGVWVRAGRWDDVPDSASVFSMLEGFSSATNS